MQITRKLYPIIRRKIHQWKKDPEIIQTIEAAEWNIKTAGKANLNMMRREMEDVEKAKIKHLKVKNTIFEIKNMLSLFTIAKT